MAGTPESFFHTLTNAEIGTTKTAPSKSVASKKQTAPTPAKKSTAKPATKVPAKTVRPATKSTVKPKNSPAQPESQAVATSNEANSAEQA